MTRRPITPRLLGCVLALSCLAAPQAYASNDNATVTPAERAKLVEKYGREEAEKMIRTIKETGNRELVRVASAAVEGALVGAAVGEPRIGAIAGAAQEVIDIVKEEVGDDSDDSDDSE